MKALITWNIPSIQFSTGYCAGSMKKAGMRWIWNSCALSGLPDSRLINCWLTGHTRSSAARATAQPLEIDVRPNLHWSPAKVVTSARPWYKNWLGWRPTSSKYWCKNSASASDAPGIELRTGTGKGLRCTERAAERQTKECSRHVEAEEQLEVRLQLERRGIGISHSCPLPILVAHVQGEGIAIDIRRHLDPTAVHPKKDKLTTRVFVPN